MRKIISLMVVLLAMPVLAFGGTGMIVIINNHLSIPISTYVTNSNFVDYSNNLNMSIPAHQSKEIYLEEINEGDGWSYSFKIFESATHKMMGSITYDRNWTQSRRCDNSNFSVFSLEKYSIKTSMRCPSYYRWVHHIIDVNYK